MKNEKGQTIVETLLCCGVVLLACIGLLEILRVLFVRELILVAASESAAQTAHQALALEEFDTSRGNPHEQSPVERNLSDQIRAFLASVPILHDQVRDFGLSLHYRFEPNKAGEKGALVTVNACVPMLFPRALAMSKTMDSDTPAAPRDCVGRFQRSFIPWEFKLKVVQFRPVPSSYHVYRDGIPNLKAISGLAMTPPDVLSGAEQLRDNSVSRVRKYIATHPEFPRRTQ